MLGFFASFINLVFLMPALLLLLLVFLPQPWARKMLSELVSDSSVSSVSSFFLFFYTMFRYITTHIRIEQLFVADSEGLSTKFNCIRINEPTRFKSLGLTHDCACSCSGHTTRDVRLLFFPRLGVRPQMSSAHQVTCVVAWIGSLIECYNAYSAYNAIVLQVF